MAPTKQATKPEVQDENEIVVDMTTAKTLEPLPTDKPYLMSMSAWKPGKSGSGGNKIHYEAVVKEPAVLAGRKVIMDVSLDNEYSLGNYKALLLGLGFPEEMVNSKKHQVPKEDDVLGLEATFFLNIRKGNDQYGDRNGVRRVRPASAYKEVSGI